MFVLGLTGSIAMGKSWGATCFRHLGIPVHEADRCVHQLLGVGGKAVAVVEAAFPGVQKPSGAIDRAKLSARVFGKDEALDALESILHPLVHEQQRRFLAKHARAGSSVVVLDVPLLYETGGVFRVDAVVVMSAPEFLQCRRALSRPAMTADTFGAILERQVPDGAKRSVADFIVSTGGPRGESLRQIAAIVKIARGLKGHVWSPAWGR